MPEKVSIRWDLEIIQIDSFGDPIYEERTAEKIPWQGTHPPKERIIDGEKLSEQTKQALQNATTVPDLKNVLLSILGL